MSERVAGLQARRSTLGAGIATGTPTRASESPAEVAPWAERATGTPRESTPASQGRRVAMDSSPLYIGWLRQPVDGVAEHVEHAREDALTHRGF